MKQLIQIMKNSKNFNQSEYDFICKRFSDKKLMLKLQEELHELWDSIFDKDNQDILKSRGLR